jgi:Predicted nucleotide-binding protein containing TIR-like domain
VKVFLGSSKESEDSMRLVAAWLERIGQKVRRWQDPDLFVAGDYTLPRLIALVREFDAALFIFGEDDKVWYRGSPTVQPRDNALLEYGLFGGVLGLERVAICRVDHPRLPTDIAGLTYVDVSDGRTNDAQLRLKAWIDRLGDRLPANSLRIREVGMQKRLARRPVSVRGDLPVYGEHAGRPGPGMYGYLLLHDGGGWWPKEPIHFSDDGRWVSRIHVNGEPGTPAQVAAALMGQNGKLVIDYYSQVGGPPWRPLPDLPRDVVILDRLDVIRA